MKTQISKISGIQQKLYLYTKREVHSDTGLPQEARTISNNLELEKQQKKPKVSRRKEIKIREEIKQGSKKQLENMKPRAVFLKK